MKFYELSIGEYFTLPEREGVFLKTWDDQAEPLPDGEAVLVNPDDFVNLVENP